MAKPRVGASPRCGTEVCPRCRWRRRSAAMRVLTTSSCCGALPRGGARLRPPPPPASPAVLALAERLLGSRAEAEDVAQETFLRLWRKAPSWRADGPPLAAWLHRVALSQCHRAWRRLGRQTEAPTAEPPDPAPLPPEQAQRAEEARRLRAALAELPLRQRAALALFTISSSACARSQKASESACMRQNRCWRGRGVGSPDGFPRRSDEGSFRQVG